MLDFEAFSMMNLQYEIRICHKIHKRHNESIRQQLTIFLSGIDVGRNILKYQKFNEFQEF